MGLWFVDYKLTINVIVGTWRYFMDEAPIFKAIGGDQPKVDPTNMSIALGIIDHVT